MKDRQALLCNNSGLGEYFTEVVWVQKKFFFFFVLYLYFLKFQTIKKNQ